jgi:hypothetical protein
MLRLEHREEGHQCEEVGDAAQTLALGKMDRGLFLGPRGTAKRQGYLLAAGVEKLNPQGPQGIAQSERVKCIPV